MKETDRMKYGYRYYGSEMKMIPTGYLKEILPLLTRERSYIRKKDYKPLIDYIKKRLNKP